LLVADSINEDFSFHGGFLTGFENMVNYRN